MGKLADRDLLHKFGAIQRKVMSPQLMKDLATLDVHDTKECIKRTKRILLEIGYDIEDFKKLVDSLRKEILSDRGVKR